MSRRALAAFAAVTLAGCATTAPVQAPAPPEQRPAPAQPHGRVMLPMSALPGWEGEDYLAALALVQTNCRDQPIADRGRICDRVEKLLGLDRATAKRFLEANLRAEPIPGTGLLTAYFSPDYPARERPDAEFSAPVRPKPTAVGDMPDRAALDRLPAPDALAWMRPEDLFFLQVQGSGSLTFPDGRHVRAAFAGSNGRPFLAIAGSMIAQGLIAARDASASGVHDWLAAHRGPEAEAVMRLDPRYVFFSLAPDAGGEPRGAAGAPLVAGRSLAVDRVSHAWFELLWIDAESPTLSGARPVYQRLTAALDAGAAIKGAVRADLYLGRGAEVGAEAGRVRHTLRLYRIAPVAGGDP